MYWVGPSAAGECGETCPPWAPGGAEKLDALVRPYPEAVAGTPDRWSFDADTRSFELVYRTARASGDGRFPAGSESVVQVPDRVYPEGYRVSVEGATSVSRPGARVLRLHASSGVREVTLHITPRS